MNMSPVLIRICGFENLGQDMDWICRKIKRILSLPYIIGHKVHYFNNEAKKSE